MQGAQDNLIQSGQPGAGRLVIENVTLALAYWAFAYLAFLVFHRLGVMPMPVWPSAALAIVAAVYRCWRIAPGIASGTVLANYLILNGSISYVLCIAIMNTLGPLVGAAILRHWIATRSSRFGIGDLFVCCFALLIVPPALAATGGIGFKWFFGGLPADQLGVGWMKWAVAHALGILLFATPVFAWKVFEEPEK
jgi:integral membrane sensor domain MASE1